MRSKLLALSCAAAVLLFIPGAAFADMLQTVTFSELSETAIPPSLHELGVTYSFAEDPSVGTGAVADFGAPFTGMASDLQSPVLLGNDPGVVTLVFDNPTTVLSFDATSALNTSNEFQVRLFNASGFSLGTTNMALTSSCSPGDLTCSNLAQAFYSYSGSAIAKAELDFSSLVPGATPEPFAIDNLSYLVPSVTPPPPTVPEPSSVWLLLSGIGFFAASKSYQFMRRKRLSM